MPKQIWCPVPGDKVAMLDGSQGTIIEHDDTTYLVEWERWQVAVEFADKFREQETIMIEEDRWGSWTEVKDA